MDHADGLDLVRLVGGEPRLNLLEVGAVAPVARNEVDVEFELVGDAVPQHRELTGLAHQYLVAGLQGVDDRGFPGAGPRRGR